MVAIVPAGRGHPSMQPWWGTQCVLSRPQM